MQPTKKEAQSLVIINILDQIVQSDLAIIQSVTSKIYN